MRNALLVSMMAIAALGCKKEDHLREKLSGLYTVESQERKWYAPDSTVSVNELGSIGLYDNATSTFNNVVQNLEPWPLSWQHNLVGGTFHTDLIGWYPDDVDGSTITFFSNPETGFFSYAIYTVKHEGGKDYSWTYVETDSTGALSYREVWKVRRQ